MFTKECILACIFLQYYLNFCHGMCDQRPHGDLKCCDDKDSACFVKVNSNRTRGQTNVICYCDRYCKFTKDCCEDIDKVLTLCNRPRDCIVSDWEPWSKCDAKCGFGTMQRSRPVLQFPENGGKRCPSLKQNRGCYSNLICEKNKHTTAIILPITFRRPKFGSSHYENILPAEKHYDSPQNVAGTNLSPTYSYCVHYKATYRRKHCEGTWAGKMERSVPVCAECQSRVMNGGHCKGEGEVGVRTRWRALSLRHCGGDWIRLGSIIPNCTCAENQFTNFVFV